ncbi:amidohydrolase family protein [Kutzneria sp. CA-103260]|uniref:amidohydrolase family protein n=1 Tax=Kutzneria sp. CA-103260 TaxID=2802641 RepID=UPI001BA4D567|nr:amidohydrolase family protein [Kutzneria sp. CA-103260]QUQ62885.1 TRZ/ATZ family hydrolase [Kutzneria sp. CA-103260]
MLVIKGGHVLGVGIADVVVDGGVIVRIGVGLAAPEVIDASGLVVLPGFVDTHRHLVQAALRGSGADLPIDVYLSDVLPRNQSMSRSEVHASVLLGAVEALNAGVTTVLDWGHVGDPAVAFEALTASGIRALFGVYPDEVHRFASSAGLVTAAVSSLGPSMSFEDSARHIALARSLGLLTTMHVNGTGVVARMADLLGPDLHFVHGNKLTDEELRLLAAAGSGLTVTPVVESVMGHGVPAYGRFSAAGGAPALGVDVVINSSADMFEQMRAALWLERLGGNDLAAASLLVSASLDGARAIGLDGSIGSLSVGKRADIVLLDGFGHLPSDLVAGGIVATAGVSDVRTVLVDGRVVKRDGVMVDHDLAALRAAVGSVARKVLA